MRSKIKQSNLRAASGWTQFNLLCALNILALLASFYLPECDALCNCFTPMSGMFNKMQKYGSAYGPTVVHPGERASWYPQAYANSMAFDQQGPIKRFNLFQPKWRGSLFGARKWMHDGRLVSPNRMALPLGWSPYTVQYPSQASLLPPSSYNQQQLYGETPSYNLPSGAYQNKLPLNPSSYSNQLNTKDGWTAISPPSFQIPQLYNSQQQQQQNLMNYGDSYGYLPATSANLLQPGKQQQQQQGQSNYGTKGASGNKQQQQQQQQYSTTKKSVLIADGGYKLNDAHLDRLISSLEVNGTHPTASGHVYPDWYSGALDSPAKIAQGLYKTQKYRDSVR